MRRNGVVGTNIVLSSLLASFSYLPFEIVAKCTLIVCILLFLLNPWPESRLVSVAGVLGVLLINRARQLFIVSPEGGGTEDQQQLQQEKEG